MSTKDQIAAAIANITVKAPVQRDSNGDRVITAEELAEWKLLPVSAQQKDILRKGGYTPEDIAKFTDKADASSAVRKILAGWKARRAQLVTADQLTILTDNGVPTDLARTFTHGDFQRFYKRLMEVRAQAKADAVVAESTEQLPDIVNG